MAPTSCFTGQAHRLPDSPKAYGAMITRAKAAPAQSRSADLALQADHPPLLVYGDRQYIVGARTVPFAMLVDFKDDMHPDRVNGVPFYAVRFLQR